jgi:hypothetical protein
VTPEERKQRAHDNVALTIALHPHRSGCGLRPTERGGFRQVCVCSDVEHRSRMDTLHELNAAAR